jgi:excisionase family DNA binding protein
MWADWKGEKMDDVQKPITVTIPTARRVSGLGHTKIYELIKQQKLKTVTVGRRRLVVYSSLEQLLSPRAA